MCPYLSPRRNIYTQEQNGVNRLMKGSKLGGKTNRKVGGTGVRRIVSARSLVGDPGSAVSNATRETRSSGRSEVGGVKSRKGKEVFYSYRSAPGSVFILQNMYVDASFPSVSSVH